LLPAPSHLHLPPPLSLACQLSPPTRSVGEVIFAEARDGSGVVAIKKLQTVRRNKDRLPFILREIEIISSSAHDNIVRYMDCFNMGSELWVCKISFFFL
jgi:serine/threonine protein kinase